MFIASTKTAERCFPKFQLRASSTFGDLALLCLAFPEVPIFSSPKWEYVLQRHLLKTWIRSRIPSTQKHRLTMPAGRFKVSVFTLSFRFAFLIAAMLMFEEHCLDIC